MCANTATSQITENNSSFFVHDPGFYKKLVLLAIPIVLQNLLTFGVIFSDNLMVGRLGDNAISGLYMGTMINTILQILLAGLESAMLILSAQYWGRRNCEKIKDVTSIGMRLSIGAALVFCAWTVLYPEGIMALMTPEVAVRKAGASYLRIVGFSYIFFSMSQILIAAMRSVEVVRIGLINSITAFVVNILLNYLLIFGKWGLPAMGVRGAAMATVISRVIEFSVVLFFVLFADRNLKLRLSDFRRWNHDIFRDLTQYGLPVLLGQAVWAFNNFWQSWVVGHLETAAITAASVTGMFDRLLWMGTWGVASATGILVGKAVGAGEVQKIRQYARTMQSIFFGIGVFSALIVFFGRDVFLSFYTLSPESNAMTELFLVVLSCILIGRCYQAPSLYGLVKSGGDTSFVFKNDTFWVFCWIVPTSLLALHLGAKPWIVFALLLSDQVTKCFVAFYKITRYNWMKNLTRE